MKKAEKKAAREAEKQQTTEKKQDFEIIKVRSSEDAFNFAKEFYHEDILIYESAFIILLNQANNVTGYAKISQGGISQTLGNISTFSVAIFNTIPTNK